MSSDLPDGYELSTDPARLDVDQLHQWLSVDAYWALGRSREAMETAIARSLNFGVYDTGSGAQVGYARVITDQATFGWLCDVYIARPVRGEGLGTALTNAVCAYHRAVRPAPRAAGHRRRPGGLRPGRLRAAGQPGQMDGARRRVT